MKKYFKTIIFMLMFGFLLVSFFANNSVEAETSKFVDIISGTGRKFGDELAIGDEHFYVLSNDGDTVRMLAKYPIDVDTECYAYAMEATSSPSRQEEMCRTRNNATGLQSSKLKGLGIDSDTVVGVPYTTYDKYYNTETYYADYENSLIKDYVEKYVKLLKKQYGASVRGDLFSLDDVISFYMVMRKNHLHATVIPDEYNWLTTSTYWTRINYYPRPEALLNIISDELYEEWENDTYVEPFYALEASALRPVITINVDNIKNYKNNKYCKDNVCFTDNDEDGKVSLSDLVCIDKECFYVLDVNKYEAKLLSRYNLESGSICTSSQMMYDSRPGSIQPQNQSSIITSNKEILGLINSYDINVRSRCTSIPIQKGIQNYKALGDRAIGFPGGGYGITQYATESHSGSKLTSYKGSIVKDYVDDYVDYLKDLTNFDITGTLIDIEDIEDALDYEFESTHRNSCGYHESMPALSTNILGIQFQKGITEKTGEPISGVEFDPCYEINLYVDEDDYVNVPYWLFSTTYWTKTSYDNYSVIAISPLVISETYVGMEDSAGVRPIIEVEADRIDYPVKTTCKDGICFTDNDSDGKISLSDEICIGKECFYVLNSDKNQVKMLSMFNLDVGYSCDYRNMLSGLSSPSTNNIFNKSREQLLGVINNYCSIIPSSYKQSYKTIMLYDSIKNRGDMYGVVEYANEQNYGKTPSSYNGSLAKQYVEKYVEYLKSISNKDITGTLLRMTDLEDTFDDSLITIDDIIPKNGTNLDKQKSYSIMKKEELTKSSSHLYMYATYLLNNVPDWLFNTNYWTKTSYQDETVIASVIDGEGVTTPVWLPYIFGIRPLITIPTEIVETGNITISACYTCGDELIWTDKPESSCILNSDIKTEGMCINNPKTGIRKIVIISLIVVSFMVLGYVLYRRHNRFEGV